MAKIEIPACPTCGTPDKVKVILYGYPSSDMDFDNVVLGGCVVTGNDPKWSCGSCGEQFGQRV